MTRPRAYFRDEREIGDTKEHAANLFPMCIVVPTRGISFHWLTFNSFWRIVVASTRVVAQCQELARRDWIADLECYPINDWCLPK